jgi:hypothetical protein
VGQVSDPLRPRQVRIASMQIHCVSLDFAREVRERDPDASLDDKIVMRIHRVSRDSGEFRRNR